MLRLRCPGGRFTFCPYLNLLLRYPQGFLCPSLRVFTLAETDRDFTQLDLVGPTVFKQLLPRIKLKGNLPFQRRDIPNLYKFTVK